MTDAPEYTTEEFDKEDLVLIHADLSQLEAIAQFRQMAGADMNSLISSIYEVQEFIEKLTAEFPRV